MSSESDNEDSGEMREEMLSDQETEGDNNSSDSDPDPDPDPKLDVDFDKAFDKGRPKGRVFLPQEGEAWKGALKELRVPTLNLQENPSPLSVLQFLYDMERYRTDDKVVQSLILQKALLGTREAEWCLKTDYDFERIKTRILHWMMHTEAWKQVKHKLENGERLSSDIETHIRLFKLVAKYMGLKAESETTKEYFIQSIGMSILPPAATRNDDGTFKKFHVIERLAKVNETLFNQPQTKLPGGR